MLQQRLAGAIWGQLCGDAAALGTHWIYDLKELDRRYPDIQGFEAPLEGHYHYGKQPGEQTHYGDAALVLMDSLNPQFDEKNFGQRLVDYFSGYTGYRDRSTRETLANYQQFLAENPGQTYDFQDGADDDEGATATRLALLLPGYSQGDRLAEVTRRLTLVTQNNPRALAYMDANARILQLLLEGVPLEDAFRTAARTSTPEVAESIRAGLAARGEETRAAVARFGASCPLPKTFPGAIQVAVSFPTDFRRAIVETLRAGGDNAGRAGLAGAWLGAALGVEAVPADWRQRLMAAERITAHLLTTV